MTETPRITAKVSEADARRLNGFIQAQDWAAADQLASELLETAPSNPVVLAMAARIAYDAREDAGAAIALCQKALTAAADYGPALSLLYKAHWTLGEKEEALAVAHRLVAAEPMRGVSYYRLATIDVVAAERHMATIQRLVVSSEASQNDRVAALTALGRIYDHRGDIDAAVGAFLGAKRCLNRPFDAAHLAHRFGWSAEAVTSTKLASGQAAPTDAPRMVFIVGLPRSGTSLIERVLAAHPDATDAGERPELAQVLKDRFPAENGFYEDPRAVAAAGPEAWREVAAAYLDAVRPFVRDPSAPVWIDKLPSNFARVGLAAMVFPTARFIVTRREPRDVFVSCMRLYFQQGHGFTETFERFAEYHVIERTFAQLWRERLGDRIIEVAYEDLTADVESEARRMIAHLGLDWRPECAAPHRAVGMVKTSSALQVREPVHRKSVGTWKRYAKQIAPLDQLLSAFEEQFQDRPAA